MGKSTELLAYFNLIQKRLESFSINYEDATKKWLDSLNNETVQIDWTTEYLDFYGKDSILQKQNGYLGEDWQNGWFVICDAGADPFVINQQDGKVYFSRHGQGAWKMIELANNPIDFLKALKCYIECYYDSFQENILDETYEIKSEFIDFLSLAIGDFLTKQQVRNFIFAVAG